MTMRNKHTPPTRPSIMAQGMEDYIAVTDLYFKGTLHFNINHGLEVGFDPLGSKNNLNLKIHRFNPQLIN